MLFSMKNQQKNSNELKKASVALFVMGGVSSLAIMTGLKFIAVPTAALFTAAGGALLIADAVMNPESVKIPEVKIPKIKIPTINVQY
jgi:predicted membrane channel-forming protein YqfA (hemolysin III family)